MSCGVLHPCHPHRSAARTTPCTPASCHCWLVHERQSMRLDRLLARSRASLCFLGGRLFSQVPWATPRERWSASGVAWYWLWPRRVMERPISNFPTSPVAATLHHKDPVSPLQRATSLLVRANPDQPFLDFPTRHGVKGGMCVESIKILSAERGRFAPFAPRGPRANRRWDRRPVRSAIDRLPSEERGTLCCAPNRFAARLRSSSCWS